MNRNRRSIIGTILLTLALAPIAIAKAADRQPNIIFMLADDLGYGDLSSYNPNSEGEAPNNTPIRTPNLNRMAKSGVRYTDFHSAAPICSPSRRALLTAHYPNRLGEWAEAYRSSPDGVVASNEPTIGMWLKEAGYATAVCGKWNVGEVKGVSWPGTHGFDDWLIIDKNKAYPYPRAMHIFDYNLQDKELSRRILGSKYLFYLPLFKLLNFLEKIAPSRFIRIFIERFRPSFSVPLNKVDPTAKIAKISKIKEVIFLTKGKESRLNPSDLAEKMSVVNMHETNHFYLEYLKGYLIMQKIRRPIK